jgi:hypothetical protein
MAGRAFPAGIGARVAFGAVLVAWTAATPLRALDADLVEALPSKHNGAYATAGDVLEVGFLTRRLGSLPGPLRFGLALQAYRGFDLIGRATGNASWAPLAVVEYAFADATLRPSLLLRAGYLFARRSLEAWNAVDGDDGLTLQPGLALDLFRAARFHVALRWRLFGVERLVGPMFHGNVAFDF